MASCTRDNLRGPPERVVLDKSSQIYAVPDWVEVGREEPKDPLQVQLGWMNALMKASGEFGDPQQMGRHLDRRDCCLGCRHDTR